MPRTDVELLTPAAGQPSKVTVDIEPGTPLWELKLQLQAATGVPVEHQRVMLAGIGRLVMGDTRAALGYTRCGTTPSLALALLGAGAKSQ